MVGALGLLPIREVWGSGEDHPLVLARSAASVAGVFGMLAADNAVHACAAYGWGRAEIALEWMRPGYAKNQGSSKGEKSCTRLRHRVVESAAT